MPYKLHHWDYDSDTDPGWPRRYLTYDYHTACWECHEPNGLLRVLQHLFGGPAVRCRHRRNKHGHGDILSKDKEWGGDVKGVARWKGCKNKSHYALAFRSGIDTSSYPDRIDLQGGNYRTRLPDKCEGHTPRGCRPNHTLRFYDCPCIAADKQQENGSEEEGSGKSYYIVGDYVEGNGGSNRLGNVCSHSDCVCRERWREYVENIHGGKEKKKKRRGKNREHSHRHRHGHRHGHRHKERRESSESHGYDPWRLGSGSQENFSTRAMDGHGDEDTSGRGEA